MRFEQVQRFILAKKIFWGLGHFKQRDLKIVNYHTLHNRGIGTLKTLKQADHKYNKKENPKKDSFTSCCQFLFFQANVLAAKEIIPGDNLFLLPTLRVDKPRRLLFDRKVSQVHCFLLDILLWPIILLVVSVLPLFLLSCRKSLRIEAISKRLTTL